MAVKIRLARAGGKKRPFYRIVAADARSPRDGRFLEKLGTYDPLVATETAPGRLEIRRDRIDYWLSVGATPTTTVRRLLRRVPATGA
jgi:small subunit ribosomal protein S16